MTSWVFKGIKLTPSPIWSFLRVEVSKFPCSLLCKFDENRLPFTKDKAFLASGLRWLSFK